MESQSLPWDRLIEGSDSIGRLADKVAAYRDTPRGIRGRLFAHLSDPPSNFAMAEGLAKGM
jgi:hypothetical protein